MTVTEVGAQSRWRLGADSLPVLAEGRDQHQTGLSPGSPLHLGTEDSETSITGS